MSRPSNAGAAAEPGFDTGVSRGVAIPWGHNLIITKCASHTEAVYYLRNDGSTPGHWREAFDDTRQRVHRALAQQDTVRVLPMMLGVMMMDCPERFEGRPFYPVVRG